MAYGSNAKPWHLALTGDRSRMLAGGFASTDDMIAAAGLGWNVSKVPLYYLGPDGSFLPVTDPAAERDGRREDQGVTAFTMVRDDTRLSLGCAVGSRYASFQNRSLFVLGDLLTKSGEARWETAGALKGGRLVWALAQLPGSFDVRRRDGSADQEVPYILFHTSHDGTAALTACPTRTRVVCHNTSSYALRTSERAAAAAAARRGEAVPEEVSARRFSIRHTDSIERTAGEAATALGIASRAIAEDAAFAQGLADTPMDVESFGTFVAQLTTGADDPIEARETVAETLAEGGPSATILSEKCLTLRELFERGVGNHGEDRYDALNAVTEFVDHQRNRIAVHKSLAKRLGVGQASFLSAQFGTGDALKRRATMLLAR